MREPHADDIFFPKGATHGVYVKVVLSADDRVVFRRFETNGVSYQCENRLSVFLSRFEPGVLV